MSGPFWNSVWLGNLSHSINDTDRLWMKNANHNSNFSIQVKLRSNVPTHSPHATTLPQKALSISALVGIGLSVPSSNVDRKPTAWTIYVCGPRPSTGFRPPHILFILLRPNLNPLRSKLPSSTTGSKSSGDSAVLSRGLAEYIPCKTGAGRGASGSSTTSMYEAMRCSTGLSLPSDLIMCH